MSNQITLTTKEQLDIYMNPQRLRILKVMDIHAAPMTCKQLSCTLGISASAVSHHIKRLENLGLVVLDHTESIHGIQAKYYKHLPIEINMGNDRNNDLKAERTLLSDYFIYETWNGFKENIERVKDRSNLMETGDAINGILYLTEAEAKQIKGLIQDFYSNHMVPTPNSIPWETAIIAFPHNYDLMNKY